MLWKDKRFWTVIIDGLASGATIAIGMFVAPDYMKLALWAVGFYQSVAGTVIAILTAEIKARRVEAKLARVERRLLNEQ